MNPLLASLGLCVLLAGLPAHAAPDPLAKGTENHDAKVIGWSDDGKRFAVRLYLLETFTQRPSEEEELPPCEGYVNHESHPFRGGLVLLAYERGRLTSTFPILDTGTCTPPAEGEKRLVAARKKLEAMGIRLEAPGKEVLSTLNVPSITVQEGMQAPYTLEYEERATPQAAAPQSGKQRGTLVQDLHVRNGQTRQKVLSRKTSYEYATAMVGYMRTGLDRVWLSPSGTTIVVVGYERVGNMQGGRKSLRILGVLGWSGSTLKPL